MTYDTNIDKKYQIISRFRIDTRQISSTIGIEKFEYSLPMDHFIIVFNSLIINRTALLKQDMCSKQQ